MGWIVEVGWNYCVVLDWVGLGWVRMGSDGDLVRIGNGKGGGGVVWYVDDCMSLFQIKRKKENGRIEVKPTPAQIYRMNP